MKSLRKQLRDKIKILLHNWKDSGLPSFGGLQDSAEKIRAWKDQTGVESIWERPAVLVTSTLGDGLGAGLKIIHMYADVVGLHTVHLGLLQSPEKIISACKKHEPDFLGLTVLLIDSEDDLIQISKNLPPKTKLLAGGPVFKVDKDLAVRANVHYVAGNVSSFLQYLLDVVVE